MQRLVKESDLWRRGGGTMLEHHMAVMGRLMVCASSVPLTLTIYTLSLPIMHVTDPQLLQVSVGHLYVPI